jgi:hypothetical protein
VVGAESVQLWASWPTVGALLVGYGADWLLSLTFLCIFGVAVL